MDATYGTRWGRAGLGILVGLGAIGSMIGFTLTQVLGFNANLVIMNSDSGDTDRDGFSFVSNQISAVDAGFGMAPVKQANGSWKNVLRAGFRGATLSGLCISKVESVAGIGNYTIKLSSPGTITASNGVFDLTDIMGSNSSSGIVLQGTAQIGMATSDITTTYANGTGIPFQANPFGDSTGTSPLKSYLAGAYAAGAASINGGTTNGQGFTGIDVSQANLYKVFGRLWQVQLTGNISLPKLSITVVAGKSSCGAWPPTQNTQWP